MFDAEVKIHLCGLKDNEQTGFVIMGGQYVYHAIRKESNLLSLVYVESSLNGEVQVENVQMNIELEPSIKTVAFHSVLCRVNDEMLFKMSYRVDNKEFKELGFTFVPSDHTWVGAKLGLFSVALDNEDNHGYADFEYFKVVAQEY